ncbi:MAG: hypothetical protein RL490_691 [Pseudomonadota bacterium]|jgi:hypothetical protein
MRIFVTASLGLALLTTAITPALAAKRPAVRAVVVQAVTRFQAADTNNSRSISSDEWSAAGAKPEAFTLVDANANGAIGILELIKAALTRAFGRAGAN